jgi:hypothetical protein
LAGRALRKASLKEVLVDLLDVEDVFNPASNVVTNH